MKKEWRMRTETKKDGIKIRASTSKDYTIGDIQRVVETIGTR